MNVFKTLKDARRRSVQTVLAATGSAETTVDEEYDIHCEKFDAMIVDMNETGAALSSTLTKQKSMFADAQELSRQPTFVDFFEFFFHRFSFCRIMAKIYQFNCEDQSWPNSTCRLEYGPVCMAYKDTWDKIHNVIRSSTGNFLV